MKDPLDNYPPSVTNNARAFVKRKMAKFYETPSDFRAQELEDLGFAPDKSEDGSDQGVEKSEKEF